LDNIPRTNYDKGVSAAAAELIARSYAMPRPNSAIYPAAGCGVGISTLRLDELPLPVAKIKTSAVPDPSGTIMLLENPNVGNYAGGTPCSWVNDGFFYTTNPPTFHGGGIFSWLFVDGHVESLQPIKTVGTGTLATPAGMWTLRSGD